MQSLNFKSQFVDPRDEVGELILQRQRWQRHLDIRQELLIQVLHVCASPEHLATNPRLLEHMN